MGDDSDNHRPPVGRQPERPGQHARYQEKPGQRDPSTLDSTGTDGAAGEPASGAALPTAQDPRRGVTGHPPLPSSPGEGSDGDAIRSDGEAGGAVSPQTHKGAADSLRRA